MKFALAEKSATVRAWENRLAHARKQLDREDLLWLPKGGETGKGYNKYLELRKQHLDVLEANIHGLHVIESTPKATDPASTFIHKMLRTHSLSMLDDIYRVHLKEHFREMKGNSLARKALTKRIR